MCKYFFPPPLTAVIQLLAKMDLLTHSHSQDSKKHGKVGYSCVKGKRKNGKCKRAVLRVRSADSSDFFEIPDVEDVHWGEVEAEDVEV